MQNCYFPAVHVDEKKENEDVKMVDLIKNNIRFDKIRNSKDQLRGAFMKVDVVSGASGSAYVEFNRTRVICAVYGPRNDTRSRKEFSHEGQLVCDFKYAPFADITGRRERGQDPDELEMSAVLVQALSPAVMLEKLPKCVISIYVVVLENDGSELSAAITCASLALADAAIEMYDLVAASSAGIVNGDILLDPCLEEELKGEGKIVLSYMPHFDQVTHIVQAGKIHHEQLQEAVDLCTDACVGVISKMMRASLASIC